VVGVFGVVMQVGMRLTMVEVTCVCAAAERAGDRGETAAVLRIANLYRGVIAHRQSTSRASSPLDRAPSWLIGGPALGY
jgi:hypothetical protein